MSGIKDVRYRTGQEVLGGASLAVLGGRVVTRGELLAEVRAEVWDEAATTKLVDRALIHALESVEVLREAADSLPPELARQICTSQIRLVYYPQINAGGAP